MKMIMALSHRQNERNQRALTAAGITSMTARTCVGRGKGLWDAKCSKVKKDLPEAWHTWERNPVTSSKVINVVVPDDKVQLVVDTIIEANQTPAPATAKFRNPDLRFIRVRTGERGDVTLD
jgi:nitrogen regulatory protein PII 2